ncbi:hypothetical protein GR702_12165 [Novosphingobium sp. FGD1]|uniref:DUF3649 domain-containing protein n=1 Tax=Novosphingobium silvae TaxID=2692619 RepID=A0A7X4GHV6_9SPHN|nr:hypothetical protein [Novosphingobium silvae]MYL98521.1 hypothetical protein [Novosphingobium silvae]
MRAISTQGVSLVSRIVGATLGAFALTGLLTAATSVLLIRMGADPVEAATGTTIASFAVFAIAAMWVFHARSVLRAWIWLAVIGAPCAVIVLTLGARAAAG